MTIRITRKLSKLSSSPLFFLLCLCLFIIFFIVYNFASYNHTDVSSNAILHETENNEQRNLNSQDKIGNKDEVRGKETNKILKNNVLNIENRDGTFRKDGTSSLSKLNLFDSKRYELVQHNDIQAPNTCVQSGLKVL